MKKFQIIVSEEQRTILQEILCRAVSDNKSQAVDLAERGRMFSDRCMDLLEDAAAADAIWTAVNIADSVEVEDE